jgi:hypothetical protein
METRLMNILKDSNWEADTTNGSSLEKLRTILSWIFGHPSLGRLEVGYTVLLGLMNANRLDHVSFLYFIVFSKDYASYQIYDASVHPVGEKIALF